ncbi:MAG: hypothetical protein AVDCRST_MAG19-2380 [uncultured Thermomicrobiales bacterium]|uniref:Uncharacterized protein n=1 Tax=uncultured Thermomicrobiales bacterium TaxID=1645740 RepID=A0A6J4V385_9BACT|nr:MAG: hypothetical protein AVDCRST_MAG19-2380 [uncultured Thermomicrobiales bacterium]
MGRGSPSGAPGEEPRSLEGIRFASDRCEKVVAGGERARRTPDLRGRSIAHGAARGVPLLAPMRSPCRRLPGSLAGTTTRMTTLCSPPPPLLARRSADGTRDGGFATVGRYRGVTIVSSRDILSRPKQQETEVA